MQQKTSQPAPNIEIIPATPAQQPVLANLLELYAHDFSAFLDLELGPDGRYGYPLLRLYWKEAGRYPFLIQVNGYWAGFIFVAKGSQISGKEDIWDVAEFFIVRRYRRRGVGRKVAREIWQHFPGKWEVRVLDRNQPAQAFWKNALEEFLGKTSHPKTFKKNNKNWQVFSFESRQPA